MAHGLCLALAFKVHFLMAPSLDSSLTFSGDSHIWPHVQKSFKVKERAFGQHKKKQKTIQEDILCTLPTTTTSFCWVQLVPRRTQLDLAPSMEDEKQTLRGKLNRALSKRRRKIRCWVRAFFSEDWTRRIYLWDPQEIEISTNIVISMQENVTKGLN